METRSLKSWRSRWSMSEGERTGRVERQQVLKVFKKGNRGEEISRGASKEVNDEKKGSEKMEKDSKEAYAKEDEEKVL